MKGSTPEGLAANPEWAVGLACARESDVVVLKGLLGPGAMWCAFCARLLGRVVISTNQTLPVRCEKKRRWWIRRLKRLLLRLCQYHIYQNPAAFEVLTEVYGCAPGRLISAPFEGGAALFRRLLSKAGPAEQSREVLGADARAIFLFVGTLLPFKGVPEIIRAAALLPESASFTCVFVGAEAPQAKKDGSIEHFTQLARSIGVEHRVRFLGPVTPEKLAEFYLASDAVLLPTQKDCFPKVLVEAALAGKPLITTTACGSAGLIVQDCANGFVIEPSDVDGLAQAMTKLLDPDLRARMGALSRRIVDQCCNMDLEVRGYVQAIERAAKHLHPRASA
ncbi:MAG: glycosyltransferase family 4 protein [Terracidiphilus sp.]